MSSTVRGTGVRSYTAATSAIRLRLRFSPLDSRPVSFWLAAAVAVAARSPSGRITTPLASKLSTSTSSAGAGAGAWAA
jgi:hypothetical protein